MQLIFNGKQPESGGAFSFTFTPIVPLVWVAGQSIKLELPAGYDTEERRFTIAAAPAQKEVVITTRISGSEFKQALDTLTPGDTVTAHSVDGTFTWRDSESPHIFAAAGIGVTPFYAMLAQRKLEGKPLSATLLYANHNDDFIHGTTFQNIAEQHPELHLQLLPSQRLDANVIAARRTANNFVYLSGPSRMVDDIGAALLASGVPEAYLIRDWFLGSPNWEG